MLPQVAELYKKYKDQGFHVVGIECQRSAVAKILQQNKAEGVEFQVTSGGSITGVKIRGIPHGFLFGADGKLIADNPPHRKLEEMVGTALDEKGVLRLFSQGLEVPAQWEKLTLEEKRNLAMAFAKTGEQPDLLLAVFYCLAFGSADQADKYIPLVKQTEALKEVLSVFSGKG